MFSAAREGGAIRNQWVDQHAAPVLMTERTSTWREVRYSAAIP